MCLELTRTHISVKGGRRQVQEKRVIWKRYSGLDLTPRTRKLRARHEEEQAPSGSLAPGLLAASLAQASGFLLYHNPSASLTPTWNRLRALK